MAHEALRLLRMRQTIGRSTVHNARRKALLPALLRHDVRRVLRLLRRTHRSGPGPDEPRRTTLARHGLLFLLQHVQMFVAGKTVLAKARCHLLLDSLQQG